MTAYGRGRSSHPNGSISVEMTSLNRKYLEIKVVLPRELAQFEADVRKWITPHLGRGALTLYVHAAWKGKPPLALSLNTPLLKHYFDEGKRFESETGVALADAFWVDWSLKQEGVMQDGALLDASIEKVGDLRRFLEEAIQEALRPFLEMKMVEGATLSSDLLARFDKLERETEELETNLSKVVVRLEEKMKSFLSPYFVDQTELEERVLREVALLAKNGDYTEEVIRLRSHIEQAKFLIHSPDAQIGKTLEFLLQEMGREVNTIGSKAQDLQVTKLIVDMKSGLEKIREQVQNVE